MTASDIPTRRIGVFMVGGAIIALIAAASIGDYLNGVICQNNFNEDGDVIGVDCQERPKQLDKVMESQVFYLLITALVGTIALDKIDSMVMTRKNGNHESTSEVRDA